MKPLTLIRLFFYLILFLMLVGLTVRIKKYLDARFYTNKGQRQTHDLPIKKEHILLRGISTDVQNAQTGGNKQPIVTFTAREADFHTKTEHLSCRQFHADITHKNTVASTIDAPRAEIEKESHLVKLEKNITLTHSFPETGAHINLRATKGTLHTKTGEVTLTGPIVSTVQLSK